LAAAANDLPRFGRALGNRAVNDVIVDAWQFPDPLVRRVKRCSLLDVAVGSDAVNVAKVMFEFGGATPTRETLKMAIAIGNAELIRLVWGRLPDADHERRGDILLVAADFHQEPALAWLFRDATLLERELLCEFALDERHADALLIAFQNGLGPWSSRTAGLALAWPAVRRFRLFDPPPGMERDCGWWLGADGAVTAIDGNDGLALRFLERDAVTRVTIPAGLNAVEEHACEGFVALSTIGMGVAVAELEEASFRGCSSVTRVVFSGSTRVIGELAFYECSGLIKLTIPSGVTSLADMAFEGCTNLKSLTIEPGVAVIPDHCFSMCPSLIEVSLPPSVTRIGMGAFWDSARLTNLVIPGAVQVTALSFATKMRLKSLTLTGSTLGGGTWQLERLLAAGARVVGPGLAGRRFGASTIVAA
jgi:hypothetical protein